MTQLCFGIFTIEERVAGGAGRWDNLDGCLRDFQNILDVPEISVYIFNKA